MKKKLALLLVLALALSAIPMNLFGAHQVQPSNVRVYDLAVRDAVVQFDMFEYVNKIASITSQSTIQLTLRLENGVWATPNMKSWFGGNTADSGGLNLSGAANVVNARTQTSHGYLKWVESGTILTRPGYVENATTGDTKPSAARAINGQNNKYYDAVLPPDTDGNFSGEGLFSYRLEVFSASEAVLIIQDWETFFTIAQTANALLIEIPIYYRNTGDVGTHTTLRFGDSELTMRSLRLAHRLGVGLEITPTAPPVPFYRYAYLNSVNIRELRADELTKGAYWVRLDAPDDYSWDISMDGMTLEGKYSTRYGNALIIVDAENSVYYRTKDGKTLYLLLKIDRTSIKDAFPETISLDGLMLVADDRAPLNSDVYITAGITDATYEMKGGTEGVYYVPLELLEFNKVGIALGWFDTAFTSMDAAREWVDENTDLVAGWPTKEQVVYFGGTENWFIKAPDADWDEAIFRDKILVARRVENQVLFRLVDEKPSEVRSGKFNQATARFELIEIAPNAWGGTAGLEVEFVVPQGVVIERADLWLNPDVGIGGGKWDDRAIFNTNTKNFIPENYVLVKPDFVRVAVPLQNKNDITAPRSLQVQLRLSIEAGYEYKFGKEIEIEVRGKGFENLTGYAPLNVANVTDPIELVVDEAAGLITSNTAYFANNLELGDIIIVENEDQRLVRGSQIWVYVAGGRQGDLEFLSDPVADVDTESGMILSRGRQFRQRFANINYIGMVYEVIRESKASTAAEITLTGANVLGMVYPNIDYVVVVSGDSVAENDYMVFDTLTATTENTTRDNEWKLFDDYPYADSVLYFDDTEATRPGGVFWDEAPDDEDDTESTIIVETVRSTLVLNELSPVNVYGTKPVMFLELPGTGFKYGLIHVREFTDFIGADPQWDDATSTATITGKDRYGNDFEVVLVSDASTMSVNGVTYDIATYSGAPHLAGQYSAINTGGYIFLPFRAMANVYGTTLDWNPLTETVTFFR